MQEQIGGLQRRESEADEQSSGDCHRRSAPRGPFKKCAKRERDEQELQARVLCDARHAFLQNLEPSCFTGHSVHKNHVQDNPSDGEQSVTGSIYGANTRHLYRHVKQNAGHQDGRDEP